MPVIQVQVPAKTKHYTIHLGQDLLGRFSKLFSLEKYTKIAIITDEVVAKFCLEPLQKGLANQEVSTIILPPGEASKNLQTVENCWRRLTEAKFDRHSLLIALGGGVVGDLTGFVAATYMRGIDYVQIPTTVIAQADSSIGGKTGFNFLGQKNNVGAFWQPQTIIMDTHTLQSLPEREFRQGFGEIIKYGLVFDRELFEFFSSKTILPNPSPERDGPQGQRTSGKRGNSESHNFEDITYNLKNLPEKDLLHLLTRSTEIKTQIIQRDELETGGQRKLLNFGHTFGHAVESLSWELGQGLPHGEAISIGMVAEAWISYKQGFISKNDLETVKNTIQGLGLPTGLEHFGTKNSLLEGGGPEGRRMSEKLKNAASRNFQTKMNPTQIKSRLIELMRADKKNVAGQIRWTLLKQIGQGVVDQVVPDELVEELLELK